MSSQLGNMPQILVGSPLQAPTLLLHSSAAYLYPNYNRTQLDLADSGSA